jgi:hypothetical protein
LIQLPFSSNVTGGIWRIPRSNRHQPGVEASNDARRSVSTTAAPGGPLCQPFLSPLTFVNPTLVFYDQPHEQ